MNDMRELKEKELLDVSGGVYGGYADVTLKNEPSKSCNNHKRKKDCEQDIACAWSEQQTCSSK